MNICNIQDIFIHDDGSLPSFNIDKLSREQVIEIYAWIKENSLPLPKEITYWNNIKKRDVPIATEKNAAELVTLGEADSFSHSIEKLKINNTEIEDLGVFVYPDSLELFYRQGSHWSTEQINGILAVLQKINSLAKNAEIRACEENGTPLESKYQLTLKTLLGKNKAD
ncbi:MAG TPA: hypothetical protein VGE32_00410 [Cellvibrio sp.]